MTVEPKPGDVVRLKDRAPAMGVEPKWRGRAVVVIEVDPPGRAGTRTALCVGKLFDSRRRGEGPTIRQFVALSDIEAVVE